MKYHSNSHYVLSGDVKDRITCIDFVFIRKEIQGLRHEHKKDILFVKQMVCQSNNHDVSKSDPLPPTYRSSENNTGVVKSSSIMLLCRSSAIDDLRFESYRL